MSILFPSIEHLVYEIVTVNGIWKQTRELFGEESALAASYQELKDCLQARLLRTYATEHVYLEIDEQTKGEALYSVRLKREIAGRNNAAHLPVRRAQEIFTSAELKRLTQR